jgi:lysophospholipase L1-like esterase
MNERHPKIPVSRGLSLLFGFYAFLFFGLCVFATNPAVLVRLSIDGELSKSTVLRLRYIQSGFFAAMLFSVGIGLFFNRLYARGADLSRWVANIVGPVSFLLLILIIAEGLLAVPFPPKYLPSHSTVEPLALQDAVLGYRLNPAYSDAYAINDDGYRGPNWTNREGLEQIYCVGDSITFGLELNDEQAPYPAKLQSLIDDKCTNRIRVLNAGVPGYASLNVLRLIEQEILPRKPAAIVLCIGWNDLIFAISGNWQPNSLITAVQPPIDNTPLALLRFARKLHSATIAARNGGSGTHHVRVHSSSVGRRAFHPEAIKQFEDNLDAIAHMCNTSSVPLFLVNMPTLVTEGNMTDEEREKASPFLPEHIRPFECVIARIAREHKRPAALDVFNIGEGSKNAFFWDHCHLTEKGASVVAEKVFDLLLSNTNAQSICQF